LGETILSASLCLTTEHKLAWAQHVVTSARIRFLPSDRSCHHVSTTLKCRFKRLRPKSNDVLLWAQKRTKQLSVSEGLCSLEEVRTYARWIPSTPFTLLSKFHLNVRLRVLSHPYPSGLSNKNIYMHFKFALYIL
jgi:hypothetical protein